MNALRRVIVVLWAFLLSAGLVLADVKVKEHTKKDGTVVKEHHRTAPNKTINDNWSTKGNVNPYTGKSGTKPREGEGAVKKRSIADPATPAPPRQRSHAELVATVERCNQLLDSYVRAPFGQSPFNADRYEEIRREREAAQGELNAGRYVWCFPAAEAHAISPEFRRFL